MRLKAEVVRNHVVAANELDKRNYAIFSRVREIVVAQNGKSLTKRLSTAIKKVLPNHTLHYNRDKSGGHVWDTTISIWGHGIDYNAMIRLRFGAGDCVDLEVYDENNTCYGSAAAERIAERDAWLADKDKADRIVDAHNRLLAAHDAFDEAVERWGCEAAKYDIEKALNID